MNKKTDNKILQKMPDKRLDQLYKESKELSKKCANEIQRREKAKIENYSKTKAIFFFIEQKILEILIIGALTGGSALLISMLKTTIFAEIFLILILIFFLVAIGFIIYFICSENWQWAKKRASK